MIRWAAIGLAILAVSAPAETVRQGALVLQFDDGWTSWRTDVAPELKRVGGKATGFVNNQYINNGRIAMEDLRALQDEFGWEIGTHTYTHQHAVRYVQQHGLADWLERQLNASVKELEAAGLRVRHLVFPFNAFTPEIGRAVLGRVGSYRRADPMALGAGLRADGSLPGTSIDLTRFVPLALLKQWVDLAHANGERLFLYGHRVLPDEAFATGQVVEVTAGEILAGADVRLPPGEDVVLVPDTDRRGTSDSLRGVVVEGRRIRVPAGSADLTRLTRPGATFLLGPSYGMRMSDFRGLIEYAAARVNFLTVSEAVGPVPAPAGAAPAVPAASESRKEETP